MQKKSKLTICIPASAAFVVMCVFLFVVVRARKQKIKVYKEKHANWRFLPRA